MIHFPSNLWVPSQLMNTRTSMTTLFVPIHSHQLKKKKKKSEYLICWWLGNFFHGRGTGKKISTTRASIGHFILLFLLSLPSSRRFRTTTMNYQSAAPPKPAAAAMTYICAECGSENEIKPKEPIRCKECGYRIMYKKRTKRSTSSPLLSPHVPHFTCSVSHVNESH